MWNPLKRGHWRKQKRNPDGTFADPEPDASGTSATTRAKAVKAEVGMLTEVAKLNKEIAAMQQAQDEAAAARAKALQDQAMNLAEQFAPAGEEPESMESTLMGALAPFIPALLAKFTQPNGGFDVPQSLNHHPANGTAGHPQAAPIPAGITFVNKDAPTMQNPNKELNQILATLSKLPDKLFTKEMVAKVCKEHGINETHLKKVANKLSKV